MKMTMVCATALILLVPAKFAQADEIGCNYSSLVGKEFVFREPIKPFKKPGVFGNKNTYLGWYSAPSDRSDHIGYEEHVGKKGKIQELPVPETKSPYSSSYWYVATLENCEKVYARSSIKSLSYLESTADIYFTETYQQAESVVGKIVWVNVNQKQRDLVLYTDDSAVSYPLSHLEPLTVVGLRTKGIGHSGVFQGSCRVNRFHYAASETGNAGRSGFSMTAPTGSQFRVFPDHRSGRFAFAAA